MKRKFFALALVLLLALPLALAGCNDDKGETYVWTKGEGKLVDLSAAPEGTAEQYQYLYEQHVVADESTTNLAYIAHPDSVLLDNGDIITAFSLGHGKGGTAMRISHDKGITWEVMNVPQSFSDNQETPTIYKLNFTDGSQRLVLIAGRPSWPGLNNPGEGWDASVSVSLDDEGNCNGLEWSEMKNFYGPKGEGDYYREAGAEKYDAVVAMSSLTQMKDENGNLIDKWMGTYHDDRNFTVYKTFLTFNEDGSMEWSEPERLLGQNDEYREVESREKFCEVEILRSPDGKELAAIFRANAHYTFSYVSFSTDEGVTWSEPQQLCKELTGDRHKAEYDPVSGKLIITMRSINFRDNNPNLGWTDAREDASRGWVAWIGDYEDLKKGEEGCGDMLVKLAHTYGTTGTEITEFGNADTGYAGVVIYEDGTVVTTSYGTFSPAGSEHGGQTYIIAKQFKIADLAAVGGVTLR